MSSSQGPAQPFELAITPQLPEIGALIIANETAMITAPTGSGKSLGIPEQLASMGLRVMVVVPTRAAVWSLTSIQRDRLKRVTWLPLNTNINDFVGFAKESDISYTNTSKIIYVTSGHARKKTLSFFSAQGVKDWDFCDVLIMDEMHSGAVDNTVIINLWSIARASGIKVPRLALISATPIPLLLEPIPVKFEVTFRRHIVKKHYSKVSLLTNERKLYAATAKLVADLHRKEPLVSTYELVSSANHILVFAPGSREVLALIEEIRTELSALKNYQLFPMYGALQEEEIRRAFSQSTPDIRKIIVATNTAETSITIEDVGNIVDTMLEKRVETSQAGGKRLVTLPISKDSADQRAGRTGRTRPGDCYRMCSETEYGELKDHRLPEIYRVPIYEIVAELLAAGLNPQWALPGVEEHRIKQTIELLRRLGLVTTNDLGDTVTDLGRFSARVQLSVRNATFLWSWWQKGSPLYLGIVIACIIDCYGPYFYVPSRASGPQQRDRTGQRAAPSSAGTQPQDSAATNPAVLFAAYLGADDLETYLKMWQDVVSNVTDSSKLEDHFDPSPRHLTRYCQNKSLNNRTVSELFRVINHTTKQLRKYQDNAIELGGFTNPTELVDVARPILLVSYSDHLLLKEGKLYYNYTSEKVSSLSRNSALFSKLPLALMALATHETGQGISGGNATSSIVDMAIVTTVDEKGADIQSHRRVRGSGRSAPAIIAAVPADALAGALALLNTGKAQAQTLSVKPAAVIVMRQSPWELLSDLPTFRAELDPWQWLASTEPIIVSSPSQLEIVQVPATAASGAAPTSGVVATPLALGNINTEVNVAREYRRWSTVENIIRTVQQQTKQTAAIVNQVLSAWLMGQVALPGKDIDAVFSASQLSDILSINQWLVLQLTQLGERTATDVDALWKTIQLKVAQYLLLAQDGVQHLPTVYVNPEDRLIRIGSYNYFFSKERYADLFKLYQQEDIVKVLLRYASCGYPLQTIHPSLAQWLIQAFQITQELVTTPLTNSYSRYYSWFPITDLPLASQGLWNTADLTGQSSLIILPAVSTIVGQVVSWLSQELASNGSAQIVVVSPVSVSEAISGLQGVVGQARFPAGSLPLVKEQDLIPNPEDYLVTVIRRGQGVTPWPTPVENTLQVLQAVNSYGVANRYQPSIRPNLDSQDTSELLVKEYSRYLTIIVPLRNIIFQDLLAVRGPADTPMLANTTYGVFENWLITLANDASPTQPDPIFSVEALDPAYPATVKLLQELSKKAIQYPDSLGLLQKIRPLITNYLQNPSSAEPPQLTRDGNLLTIGELTREFPDGRLDILLGKANLVAVAAMTTREACLMPRGRQYTQPLAITKYYVEKCGVNLEGFATPINAQILAVNPNLWFCSLFPDTDGPFGSQGSFFRSKFSQARMTIYPPFIEAVVNSTARHLATMFAEGSQLFAIIAVPNWTDAEFYPILTTSVYCKAFFTIKKFENYSEDLRGRHKLNKVDDIIVIWNKGYPDLDWKDIERNVISIHKKGVQKLVKRGAALKRT